MEELQSLCENIASLQEFELEFPNFFQYRIKFLKLIIILKFAPVFPKIFPDSNYVPDSLKFTEIDLFFETIIYQIGETQNNFQHFLTHPDTEPISEKKFYQWTTLARQLLEIGDITAVLSHLYERFLENPQEKGSFYTPQWLVTLQLEILVKIIQSDHSFKHTSPLFLGDLSCGTGNFLLPLKSYFPKGEFYGFDIDPWALEICRMNVYLKELHRGQNYFSPSKKWHLHLKDSLKQSLGRDSYNILVGNPPWGANLDPYKEIIPKYYSELLRNTSGSNDNKHSDNPLAKKYSTYFIRDQLDSFALFVYRNIQLLTEGGYCSLVLPSTLLFNPVYEPLRKFLLTHCKIEAIVYVGESIFSKVNIPSIIIFLQKVKPTPSDEITIQILESVDPKKGITVKDPPKMDRIYRLPQINFLDNIFYNFTIFESPLQHEILKTIRSTPHYHFGDFVKNSRGVELGKNGEIYQCPKCKKWNPKPFFKKKKGYKEKFAKCNYCQEYIIPTQIHEWEKIIVPNSEFDSVKQQTSNYRSLIVGESLSKFEYAESHYIQLGFEGIKYKSPEIYEKPKILIRKTGKGIFGAIDYHHSYTVQVIYQFSLKQEALVEEASFATLTPLVKKHPKKMKSQQTGATFSKYSLEFLFGVISSKLAEFYYFHMFSNPLKKVFPHLIQANILALPIPKIKFEDPESVSYQNYEKIVHLVSELNFESTQTHKGKLEKQERIVQINTCVMNLFNVSGEEQEYITTFHI